MSLFPAYCDGKESIDFKDEVEEETKNSDGAWLQNTSFVPALTAPTTSQSKNVDNSTAVITLSSDNDQAYSSSRDSSHHKHHKKHKKKHKKEKRLSKELMENNYGRKRKRSSEEPEDDKPFYTDKKKEPDFYGMVRLCGPNVPKYRRGYFRTLGRTWYQHKEKLKRRRYYNPKYDKSQDVTVLEETEDGSKPEWLHDVQAELKSTTEVLNRTLAQEPHNISAWLKLCRLQPSLLSLSPRNGPGMLSPAERRTVTEKQIAILDKALNHNPTSGELIKERYGLASTVVPGDSLASELRTRLELEPCLLAGWLELARIERSHLASCSVPQVTNVFADAMTAINSRRKKEPTLLVETNILELALASGIFLQEAGLQEQVWTMLRLYTETYLPACRDPIGIAELQTAANQRAKALEEEAATKEDELLSSGLPSSELWLRIERLREAAHFLPAPDCVWAREGDPQRLVYPEDLAHLSQPIMSPKLTLRIAVTALVVLGAPPLPFTHNIVQGISGHVSFPHLGLLATVWPILAADIATPVGWLGEEALFFSSTSGCGPLTPGPGGQLYRSLLHTAFHRYAACLEAKEATLLLCWWLRLETLFARISPDTTVIAHVRSGAKKLLKKPENRTQTQMFREFAMLESALAKSTSAAEKILIPSVQASRGAGPIEDREDHTALCSVYRSLAEIWASHGQWSKVTSILCALAVEEVNPISTDPLGEQVVNKALNKFEQVTTEILTTQQNNEELDLLDLFSENFFENWVSCYAWLLVSTENIWSAGAMLERTIQKLDNYSINTRASNQKEKLYQTYIAILELNGRTRPGGSTLLRQILQRALTEYPNNSSLLAIQSNLTIPIGQDSKYQIEINNQLLGNIIRLLTLEHRIKLHEIAEKNSSNIEIIHKCNPKIIAQFERLVNHFESRHCPLIWRLYLRYVGSREKPDNIKLVFYKALEDCPWVKALYLQGATLLPEELGNIQDLLVEKELRLHVAPEELEILRND